MPYIRLSPSLLSIHLSNNPGISGKNDQGVEYSELLRRKLGLKAECHTDSVVPDFIIEGIEGKEVANTGLLSLTNRKLI